MKDFNIDQIEKKTPYAAPENFFAEVQEQVIQEVLPARENRIRKLRPALSIAAAVLLLFGLAAVWNLWQEKPASRQQMVLSKNMESTPFPEASRTAFQVPHPQTDAVAESLQKTDEKASVPSRRTAELQELFMSSLSDEELSALTDPIEQDIYLELYK